MDYKKTRWRDITHELTGQVQFRPENSRRPLNIPIRETQQEIKQKEHIVKKILMETFVVQRIFFLEKSVMDL